MRTTGMENTWTTILYKGNNGDVFDCQLEHYTLPRPKWSLVSCEEKIVMDIQFDPLLEISLTGDVDSSGNVIEGDSFVMTCFVLEVNPDVETFIWFSPNQHVISNEHSIHFETLPRKYSGNYTCQARNTFWDDSEGVGVTTISVNVQYPPTANIVNQTDVTVIEGDTYIAECLVDSNPVVEGIWIHPDGSFSLGPTLDMRNISRTDSGTYTCFAETVFWDESTASDSDSIHINVEYPSEESTTHGGIIALTSQPDCQKLSRPNDYEDLRLNVNSDHVYMKHGEVPWEIPRASIRLGEVIAKGIFGKVVKATTTCNQLENKHLTVAVKMLNDELTDEYNALIIKELEFLKSVTSHAHIVTLIGCCTQDDIYFLFALFAFCCPIFVVLEYMTLGSLLTYIRGQKSNIGNTYANLLDGVTTISEHNRVAFSHQIYNAMEFIEGKGCVHRDLASRNVLLNENLVCKLSGFGLSTTVLCQSEYEQKTKGRLPVPRMAPESIFDGVFSTKSDVWSYGIVLWEIATLGDVPYKDMSMQEVIESIQEGYRMTRPD
ncbi:fibroblast growth factor receptor 2-like [Saccoglossus kowalevskii]|uniref:Fibroblast growth factor receptor 3-like n=1 Tax=Saccoglossus kowalevskii TaxID=10224 RepID=A0ABM0GM32_SACKO|nr:PREDICTED: fibroblast growth factor receptor 3-like [Saccoglossus kowalevskii]